VYYRLYITYILTGFLFDLDQKSKFCTDIQKIESLIRKCVLIPQKLCHKTNRLQTPKEVEEYFPDFFAFIDSTEQQIPRPIDKRRRKTYYSCKKKRSTIKTQLMVNNRIYIIHKAPHKKGRRHDYDIYKRNHIITPKEVVTVVDLGYLDIEPDFPEQLSALSYRKKRKLELSAEEIAYNKSPSKNRIVIAHTICRLKKCRIMSDTFRNKLRKYDRISDIVADLINYRIMNHHN
jgi:hypothetical protein